MNKFDNAKFMNASLPAEERADDLLKRMSMERKNGTNCRLYAG